VFEFTHEHGLAVVGVGPLLANEPVFDLFNADDLETVAIRTFFSSLGTKISSETALLETRTALAESSARIRALENKLEWLLKRKKRFFCGF